MVRVCYLCKRRSDEDPSRSFHRFPSNSRIRAEWLRRLGVQDNNTLLPKHAFLCSLHFNPDELDVRASGARVLKNTALPLRYVSDTVESGSDSTEDSTSSDSMGSSPTGGQSVPQVQSSATEKKSSVSDDNYLIDNPPPIMSFPSYPLERVVWFERLGLPMDNKSTYISLCSDHFLESDIVKDTSGKRHVRRGALPMKVGSSDSMSDDDSNDSSSSSTSTASERPEEVQIPESPKVDSATSPSKREVVLPDSASGESSIESHKENLDTICFFCKKEQSKEDQNISQHTFPSYQGSLFVCSKHFDTLKRDVGAVQMGLQAVSGPTRDCNSDAIKINTNTNSQNINNDTTENQRSVNTAGSGEIAYSDSVSHDMPRPIKTETCSGTSQVYVAKRSARFASELKPEDFQTPDGIKRSLHLVFHTIKKKDVKIRTLQQKDRRSSAQIASLRELVAELRRENETLTKLISKKKVKTQG